MAFSSLAILCAALAACALAYAFGRRGARASGERATRASFDETAMLSAAHELRTPLTGVIGAAELLIDSGLTPEQRTYARAIQGSATAMIELVDETLGAARSEEPAASGAETIVVAEFVGEIAELLAPRAQARGLDFAALVAEDAPAEIMGDAGRIRQILINLAGNAMKFTTEGGVGLRVERSEGGLAFKVLDTGPGFDPKQADRLFRAFERAPDAVGSGVGLGLAISRKLAAAMGGSLDGHSERGVGATFTLTLPCWGADPEPNALPLAHRRVALVSEAPFTGPWLVEWLGAQGAEAALFKPEALAVEGAARLAAFRPDVAIVDKSAGAAPEFAALARAAGASRVLLLLAPAERKALENLSADGFDGYLVKPVRSASLTSRLIEDDRPFAQPQPGVAFPQSGGLKVLVAEDDPVSALIALAHLSRLGHASVHVADGEAAVARFETEAFDVVMLDMMMPRLDGRAAAGRMRVAEAASGRRAALIVALTAEAGDTERADFEAAGVDHVLAKPLDRRALERALAPLAAERLETA